jgi:hypothetical protein
VRLANLKLTWRGKNYYASGAAQKDLGAGADMAAIQTGFQEAAFSFLHEE